MTVFANEAPSEKNLFQTILTRRSVRAYAPDDLDHDIVQILLEAAIRAPTAMHEEPWAFIVVQNRQILKQLSDLAKPLFIERVSHSGHDIDKFFEPGFNVFYDAGTLIVICSRAPGPFVEADCWLAAENLMLAACAIGLGSCVIGSSIEALNLPEGRALLGMPAEFTVVAPIIVGVSREETAATLRLAPLVKNWIA